MTHHDSAVSPFGSPVLHMGHRKEAPDAGRVLSQIAGVCFAGGHQALFDLGTAVAEIDLSADGSLRLRADAPGPADDWAALHASGLLPGNLRFARDSHGRSIVADTQINGAAHLPRTLHWLRAGLVQALDPDAPPTAEEAAAIDRGQLGQALGQLSWAAEGVVEQDDGWELRPRIRGDVVPVRLTLENGFLEFTRRVLPLPAADGPASAAVADQAVRFNDQLRHARLAACGGHIVAETRLHSGLVEPGWLAQAACAVAHASRFAAPPLRILASQPLVAETYFEVFCSTVEQPAPTGAGL